MALAIQIIVGLILSGLIGYAAYRRGSLSRGGVLGAIIVGTAIFGFGGLAWGLILITFFVTSSLLSHYKESAKENLAEKFDKGHQRDLGQALANGGVGALCTVAWGLNLWPRYLEMGKIYLNFQPEFALPAAFLGAMATVNADTWATELGVLNKGNPRLITNLKPVDVGTSGGISLAGTLAAFGGALVIGAAFPIFDDITCHSFVALSGAKYLIDPCRFMPALIPIATLAGLGGSLFDSLLGATVQAIYYCPSCQKETERKLHTCGTPTILKRGWRWLNNDWVNFISSLVGAGIAAGLWVVINK